MLGSSLPGRGHPWPLGTAPGHHRPAGGCSFCRMVETASFFSCVVALRYSWSSSLSRTLSSGRSWSSTEGSSKNPISQGVLGLRQGKMGWNSSKLGALDGAERKSCSSSQRRIPPAGSHHTSSQHSWGGTQLALAVQGHKQSPGVTREAARMCWLVGMAPGRGQPVPQSVGTPWLGCSCPHTAPWQSKAGQQQGAGTGHFPGEGKDSEMLMGSSFLT